MRFNWLRLAFWPLLSVLLSSTLLAAAALKGHELATTDLLEHNLLTSRWFLVLVVEWEIFFALWLLGGFYRSFPQTTCWVALLYFFALFVVAMDSVLKGRPSCPCFGKATIPPWFAAGFDLAVLLFLAVGPALPPSKETRSVYQWFGLAGIFSVFGPLSLIAMVDYSTAGVVPSLRKDPRLFAGVVTIQRVRPTTEEFLDLLGGAAGLNLTADERLLARRPNYGTWNLKKIPPWAVMELLAARQKMPARWQKTEDGYEMVPAVWFGKGRLFWFGGVIVLALFIIRLCWWDVIREWENKWLGDTGGASPSVADVPAAK